MKSNARRAATLAVILLLALSALPLFAQPTNSQTVDPSYYKSMQWRLIGPFRAGRISAVSGVPGSGTTFYAGTPAGGVWKTTDAGQVWTPIFDSQPVSSIGALAVSQSSPNIIYVGSGEQNQGDGVYKSTDAGATWTNIGLRETHVITMVLVDPKNPDIVLVGASGDRSSGAERGVYKSKDGGKTWSKTLFKDNDTAVMDMSFEAGTPKVVYAALQHRLPNQRGAGGGGGQQAPREQDAFIYKSTDEGSTWKPIEGKGLPSEAMGRTGVAVAPGTKGNTVYVIAGEGLFKSTDGGANFTRSTTDPRVIGNGYFSRVFVDSKNANNVYVAQTTMYRSTNGGKTFDGWYGAPSGDDIHMIWIDPVNTQNLLLGVDQGAIVSLNGGKTWSSWYNQPTGQFYHVSTDNHFPYYVYGAEQDSGTAAVSSRTDFGLITYRDWAPTGGFEFAFIAPDPLNPNLVYTGGWYGSVLRFDKVTGQITHLFVRTPKYRTANMAPISFSPQDPHTIYIAAQFVLKTSDEGMSWQEVSPDLTKKPPAKGEQPPEPGGPRGPVISTLALSTVTKGVIWAGTSNGLIHVTKDGSTWQNVTPPGLPERATINALEASRHDAAEAYAVVNVPQDVAPYVFRTRDFGQTWQAVVTGLDKGAIARIVREDPARKGLLYAGTENAAYVSFDDGDHWQSLQLNLPVTPVRDFEVHGNDLVVATYGRALWILDDLSPLRQIDDKLKQADAALLKPDEAIRARWDVNNDTPLQPETPAGKNPPEGAIIDYYLKSAPAGEIKLAVYDSQNRLVREFSSIAPKVDETPPNVPNFWFAPPATLTKTPGHNRFAWDLRFAPPKTLRYGYYGSLLDYVEYTLADHALPGETPREQPLGPIAIPGEYTVALTVNGQTFKQPLLITPDPRVKTSQADLVQQLNTENSISAMMEITGDGYMQLSALRTAIAERQKALAANAQAKDASDSLKALDDQVVKIADGGRADLGIGPINRELARLMTMVSSGDSRPAAPLQEATAMMCQELAKQLAQWRDLNAQSITQANTLLQKVGQAAVPAATSVPNAPDCK